MVIQFGLKNAPETFQRSIDAIIASVKSQLEIMYLDDVIIFSNYPEDHISHVRSV